MKKLLALLLSLTASCAVMASCSGSSDDSDMGSESATTTSRTATTTSRRAASSRRDDDSRSLMSSVDSKADELGDDVADGIDATLSTAGDITDNVLR